MEIKRRNPQAKPDASNKTLKQLMESLMPGGAWPLFNHKDVLYVRKMETTCHQDILEAITEPDVEKKEASIAKDDRIQFIVILQHCDNIREAYMRSQDVMSREELDKEAREPDFFDLILWHGSGLSYQPFHGFVFVNLSFVL